MNNNVIHEMQKGQVHTILIYDIPTAWLHDDILNKLSEWGQVPEISFKSQCKYQFIWAKMILKPLVDMTWTLSQRVHY